MDALPVAAGMREAPALMLLDAADTEGSCRVVEMRDQDSGLLATPVSRVVERRGKEERKKLA
jgi:hypothetical protein